MRFPRPGREIAAFGGAARFRGKDVLDLGTGNGRLALEIARHARSVVGVDTDASCIREAEARAARVGIRNCRFRVGDAVDPGPDRERFDVAVFSWSL